jgi:hypothetical protein
MCSPIPIYSGGWQFCIGRGDTVNVLSMYSSRLSHTILAGQADKHGLLGVNLYIHFSLFAANRSWPSAAALLEFGLVSAKNRT